MKKRIVFTGGTGKAGRHVVPYLVDKGYEVLNVDLAPLDYPGVNTINADIADSGQMFDVLSSHFGFEGFETGKGPAPIDAVVHFAAVPRVLIKPDNETFRINTIGTYNVIEAAVKLGIKKIIVASSETTYGVCFAEGDKDFHHFPLEEDYDSDPMDSYGLSKVLNEKTARAFAMRFGADIYALRIGNVIEPHEYDRFPAFLADPMSRKRNAWSYIDARSMTRSPRRFRRVSSWRNIAPAFRSGASSANLKRPFPIAKRERFWGSGRSMTGASMFRRSELAPERVK